MTNEAIEKAKETLILAKQAIDLKYGEGRSFYSAEEATREVEKMIKERSELAFIVEAIEKQIPKRLKDVKRIETGFNSVFRGYCPICNEYIVSSKSKYCFDCGQRLDWEEARERYLSL